jgi:antiviral helicase SKI2
MMPTLCFILSRKRCEAICETWSLGLLTKDEVALILRDWRRLVRDACRGNSSLLKQIEALPQYRLLTDSIQKGVAFHHSGVIPILKECVEMLMKDGRIPCVFATETFAVGINSPTRTVIMSQIDKRTEGGVRCLEPHEYTQMGGRAGRRGLDTVGYVVSLPISFVKKTSPLMYHRMTHGSPVHISSTQVIPSIQVMRALVSKKEAIEFDDL